MATLIDGNNSEIDFESLSTNVLIIGSGPAGLALALRLSQKNVSYLVVESGDQAPGNAQRLTAGENSGLRYFDLSTTRVRALGGTTHMWGGNTAILSDIDFESRSYIPHSGWPIKYSEFRAYGEEALETLNLSDDWDPEQLGDPVKVWPYRGGAFRIGTFKLSPVIAAPSGVTEGRKGNYYQYNARSIKGTVLLNTTITRLEIDPNGSVSGVTGVTANGKRVRLMAERYVLACGGIENARFLLINRDQVGGPLRDLPALGKYFMEHPHPLVGKLKSFNKIPRALGKGKRLKDGGVWQWRLFLKEDVQRRLGCPRLFFRLTDVRPDRRASIVGFLEQSPNPSSHVTLSTDARDDLGDPLTKLHYELYDWEYERYYRAAELLAVEFGAQGIGRAALNTSLNSLNKSTWLGGGHHHMGTTRCGTEPQHSVVDANLKVWGFPNLYVAGSSVFPTSGCVNPTVNIIMLSLRLGDRLAQGLQ